MHTYRIIQVHGVHGMADLGCRLLRDGKCIGSGSEREMLRLSEEMQVQDRSQDLPWKRQTTTTGFAEEAE